MKSLLLYAWLVGGQAADVGTTCAALRGGGYVEGNRVLPRSCGGIAAVKGSLTLGAALLSHRIHKTHPKWSLALRVVPGATGLVGASFNLTVMTR